MASYNDELKSKVDVAYGTLTNLMILATPELMRKLNDGIYLIPDKLRMRNPPQSIKEFVDAFRTVAKIPLPPFSDRVSFILLELFENNINEILEDSYNPILRALLAFRLYKEGDIYLQEIYQYPKGGEISLHSFFPPIVMATSAYILGDVELTDVINIIQKVHLTDFEEETSLRISCDRFSKSYQEPLISDKLIDLCIGFEALFLKGEYQKSELGMGQVIGLACSMLIGKEKSERTDIKNNIESGFSLRNKVVHGYYVDENRHKRMEEILPDFENNLRRSILKLL